MKKKFAEIFCCPYCHGELKLKILKEENDKVTEGFFICKECNKKYKIKNGIPIFI